MSFANEYGRALEAFEGRLTSLTEQRANMPPGVFARELGTMRMDLGRQSGKTLFVRQRARAEDLVITPSAAQLHEYADHQDCRALVVTADELKTRDRMGGMHFERIFIDDLKQVTARMRLEQIYMRFLMQPKPPIFILIGE